MTAKKERPERARYTEIILFFALTLCVMTFSVKLSPLVSAQVRYGLRLCFEAVIGSVFPFMILTDLITETTLFRAPEVFRRLFEKLFKINGEGVGAFLLGLICGFPTGVRMTKELFESDRISKDEFERLVALSSNMGPAFIISGVGIGLLGSVRAGLILYFSSVISAALTGMLFGIGKSVKSVEAPRLSSSFSLVTSIKNATQNTLSICGFIVFFSILSGLASILIKSPLTLSAVLSFLEVSNAAKFISALNFQYENLKFMLISFSVSFCGLSIFMQTKSFFSKPSFSSARFLLIKLAEGIISALVTWVLLLLI